MLVGLGAAVVVLLLYEFALLDGLEGKLLDLRFHLRGSRPAPTSVVIVAIDDKSLGALGEWPWPRQVLARIVRGLHAGGAGAIGLDLVELTRPAAPGEPQGEAQLARAIAEAGNVVLPLYFSDWREGGAAPGAAPPAWAQRFLGSFEQAGGPAAVAWVNPYLPSATLCEAAAGLGAVNVVSDLDGVTRTIPVSLAWQGRACPSFALELARVASGQPAGSLRVRPGARATLEGIEVPLLESDEAFVNHYGPYGAFRYVSVNDVLQGRAGPNELRGKVVLVGKLAAQLGGKLRTSLHHFLPAVELQATATANVLRRDFLVSPPAWTVMVAVVLLAVLTGLLCAPRGPGAAVLVLVAVVGGIMAAGVGLFLVGVVVRVAEPLAAAALAGLVMTSLRSAAVDRSRARAESAIETLTAIGETVRSTLNRPELLRAILEWVRRALAAEAASLLTLDEERQELVFEIALGEKGEQVKAFRVPVGEGIVGYVAQTGESVIVADPSQDLRFRRDIADAVEFPVRSALCVPLKVQDRLIGVVEVLNKLGGEGFSEADRGLLEIIGSQAAVFLENVRLYNVLEQRVDFANRELLAANRELATEKGRIEAIVQGMADGLIGLNTAGNIGHVNEAAEHMLGVREGDLIGRPAAECFQDEQVVALFHDLVAGEHPPSRELTIGAPRAAVLRATAAPVVGEDGVTGTVVVLSDITQLKELDRMKSELVSLASHELRSPLTAIKGFTALLTQHPAEQLPAESRECLRIIDSQVDRMRRLIDDFLNIARIEAGRPLEMNWSLVSDLPAMVQEVMEASKLTAPEHRFELSAPAALPAVEADRDKLYEILANLLSNAVKYSPRGGVVRVSLHEQDGELIVNVNDQGVGISEDQMAQLFQRFRRVKSGGTERVTGTGLGLYLTKHLVEAHGGRIWAESEPGRGSTFTFAIPCASAGAQGRRRGREA